MVSTAVFLVVGQPVAILLAVGALNALVLPVGLSAMLVAARRAGLMNGYRHPGALTLAGAAAALAMAVLGAQTVGVMVGGWLR
ncbi:MAG TPA: hypothetical protein VGQ17_08390 [Gemmatimonadales bacterium]|nr:hypothetical protein [Gemmatimonadales bacterium]